MNEIQLTNFGLFNISGIQLSKSIIQTVFTNCKRYRMETAGPQLEAILKQVETTKVFINTHADGYFISAAQVKAIREIKTTFELQGHLEGISIATELPIQSSSKNPKLVILEKEKARISKEREDLENEILITHDKAARTKLNQQIQAKTSEISRVNRDIKKL